MSSSALHPTARRLGPFLADLVCVIAFALGGKSSHEADASNWVVLAIVWPFALAVSLAHLGLVARDRQTTRVWPDGVLVVVATYVLGMALRVATGRGIALGFLLVAIAFLTVTMLGWRALVAVATRARTSRPV